MFALIARNFVKYLGASGKSNLLRFFLGPNYPMNVNKSILFHLMTHSLWQFPTVDEPKLPVRDLAVLFTKGDGVRGFVGMSGIFKSSYRGKLFLHIYKLQWFKSKQIWVYENVFIFSQGQRPRNNILCPGGILTVRTFASRGYPVHCRGYFATSLA